MTYSSYSVNLLSNRNPPMGVEPAFSPASPAVTTPEKIAAAQSLLPEHSIFAIARMVGVSRGTIYAHVDAITAGRRS
jgi:hypothetical protein